MGSILLRMQWSRLLRILAWRTARKVSAPRTKLLGHWLIGLGLASEGIFGLTPRQDVMRINQERVDGSAHKA